MADASTTRSTIAYTSLIAAIVIPFVEKHWNVTLTLDNIADFMAAAVLAWHGISSFIESRWPPKTQPSDIDQIVAKVVAELKATTEPKVTFPFSPTNPEPKP